MINIETLYFEDTLELAEHIEEIYDGLEEYDEVSVVAPYYETKELLRDLVTLGYDVVSIYLSKYDYFGDYLLSINHEGIWIEKAKNKYGYLKIADKVTYISNNANSAIMSRIKSDYVVAFELDDDTNECNGDCENCDLAESEDRDYDNDLSVSVQVDGKEIANKAEREKIVRDILLDYCKQMDEYNESLARMNRIDKLIKEAFRA